MNRSDMRNNAIEVSGVALDKDMEEERNTTPSEPLARRAEVLRTVTYYDDGSVVDRNFKPNDARSGTVVTNYPTVNPFDASLEEARKKEAKPAAPAPRVGDAGPLALLAFGGTTALYCSHVAGKSEMNMTTMGMVLAYGGMTQIICAIFELINRNTFPGTAFMTYGSFWLASAAETLISSNMPPATAEYGGGHALVWFVITLIFLGNSLRMPVMCIMVFFLLDIFFLILAIAKFQSNTALVHAAGYEGIVTGAFAIYAATGMLLRDVYGRTIIPLIDHDGFRFRLL